MDSGAWQPGYGNLDLHPFGAQHFEGARGREDWEDWLKWDPSAEPASPGNAASNSGSSKNDSPIQQPVWPRSSHAVGIKGGAEDTIAPPMIVGDDVPGFGADNGLGGEQFLFGAVNAANNDFAFGPNGALQDTTTAFPKLDTSGAPWTLPSNAGPDYNISLSALSTENGFHLPMTAPGTATTPSLGHSPHSSTRRRSSTSSNSPPVQTQKKRGGRKRKAEPEVDSQEELDGSPDGDGDGPPVKKTSHNVIEKRYRNNLNDKIVELRNSVPSLRAMTRANRGDDTEDLQGLTAAHKHNKATIMAKATEYIKHLEKRNKTVEDEVAQLKARLRAVEAAVGKNRDQSSSLTASPASPRTRQPSSSSQPGQSNFLNVPQEQSVFSRHQSMQQQYMQSQQPPVYSRPPSEPVDAQNRGHHGGRAGGLVNRVMLGTMAGVIAMEGLSEQQGDSGSFSALGALPFNLFKRSSVDDPTSVGMHVSHSSFHLLKMVLVIGAALYLITPLISFSPRPKQKVQRQAVSLSQVPSLASPVEVRRKAWLTAVQTVWIPKHFLLEVVAVTGKMIKLSLRRLVGTETFNAIAGTSQEDEVARIKAWDIAIDAQLAGGDAEVSYYRLLLTLMASGTLPDSPTRLMQKAVHFRVFFWEVANAGYGNLIMFKKLTEKVGRIYWDSARRLQKELEHSRCQGRPYEDDDVELLPDHLARLLELDCDEVLSDEMIQRAWNLAWNKPSAYNTDVDAARDRVVEDHAIRSPLDAVAAWYANIVVDDTLAETLHDNTSSMDTEYYLALAVSISPPSSGTQARTLAAKAILSRSNRNKNVVAALESLPVSSPTAGMTMVTHTPVAPDIHTALTLGKILALLSYSAPTSVRDGALQTLSSISLPPSSFTLLTAVASYKLLQVVNGEKQYSYSESVKLGPEELASSLRVWAGTSAAHQAGLSHQERGAIVELCLTVAKKVGGWSAERDSGYGGSAEASPIRPFADLVRV